MNYKRITIVLFTLSFIMILIGSTFAYWSWESTNAQRTLLDIDNISSSYNLNLGNNFNTSNVTNMRQIS